ncbi:MAG TPA: hypothetical protein VFM37_17225 [Pseudonocardiaceae bacterium]|nr:hypothetical protein [Pseudonocardiaceae bacterium]
MVPADQHDHEHGDEREHRHDAEQADEQNSPRPGAVVQRRVALAEGVGQLVPRDRVGLSAVDLDVELVNIAWIGGPDDLGDRAEVLLGRLSGRCERLDGDYVPTHGHLVVDPDLLVTGVLDPPAELGHVGDQSAPGGQSGGDQGDEQQAG